MFEVDFHILNQKATPAIYADILANRPAAGFAGRLFVATDSPYGVFRDTGTAWVQVASNGGGGGSSTGVNGLNGTTNIGLGGTLANNTIIDGGFNIKFNNSSFTVWSNFQISNYGYQFNNKICFIQPFNDILQIFVQDFVSNLKTGINYNYDKIESIFFGVNYGLLLDDTTGKFALGDYGNDRKYNSIVVNDDTDRFYFTTTYNQANTDQDLLYASNNTAANERFIKLGDFNGYQNNYSLIVDDQNQFIKTTNVTGDVGIILTNSFSLIGSYNFTQYLFLSVDYGLNSIAAFNTSSTSNGLSLDFAALIYQFGGFNQNGNYIKVDDTTNDIEIHTSSITFTGAALESAFSGLINGKYLVINLNGNQYKIALQDPN